MIDRWTLLQIGLELIVIGLVVVAMARQNRRLAHYRRLLKEWTQSVAEREAAAEALAEALDMPATERWSVLIGNAIAAIATMRRLGIKPTSGQDLRKQLN